MPVEWGRLETLVRGHGELREVDLGGSAVWVWTCRYCRRRIAGSYGEVLNNSAKHLARHGVRP